ncbi:DUF1471 domain-containing protein [Cronobacter dublinensis]|uniref:DUF1471 domain-containing protein n=1 Tax=Cronobacter dublinensis TaxID=413497 RepID=A0A9Q4T7S8_9ENTR|nr:DUF1471 domain-containing protein [Cronobacter dublinensis]NCH88966.1 DUF1471 domain-containing protein [Cronobacter dublinensis]NHV91125.1 DUF1471 domain-containing protein [Cronobacter dublinensis]
MRKKIIIAALLIAANLAHGAFASTISATGLSLQEAEDALAKKAEKKGVSYKITGAHYGNYVYLIGRTKH